jgi:hypothetical protein
VCRKCRNYEEAHRNFRCNFILVNASLVNSFAECEPDFFVSVHAPAADLSDDGNLYSGFKTIGNILIL